MERNKTRIWAGGLAEILRTTSVPTQEAQASIPDLRLDAGSGHVGRPRMVSPLAESVPPLATRVMSADELRTLREAQRAIALPTASEASQRTASSLPASDPQADSHGKALVSGAEPSARAAALAPAVGTDSEVHLLTARLRSSARIWKRVGLALAIALLAGGGWYARRASATSRGLATRSVHAQASTPRTPNQPRPEVLAMPATPNPPIADTAAPEATPRRPSETPRVRPRAVIDALAAGDDLGAAHLYRTLASQVADPGPYLAAAEILSARAKSRARAEARSPR